MTIEHEFVRVLAGAKGNRHPVHLVLNSGLALDVWVSAAGCDALSGEISGAEPRGVVIPLRSLSWIDAPGCEVPVGALQPPTRPSFGDFLENSQRLSHRVTVRTPGGLVSGVICDVTANAVSVVDAMGNRRRVATASIDWFSVGG